MGSDTSIAGLVGKASEPESFAFVLNIMRLTDAPSYMLVPDHFLRKASTEEIKAIKRGLETLGPAPYFRYEFFWEISLPHLVGPVVRLPEEEWRYFVVSFRGTNKTINDLQAAFDLTELELEIGFTILEGPSTLWHPGRLFHVIEGASANSPFFVDVSARDVEEMSSIHTKLQAYDNTLLDLQALVQQLGQLKALPHYSPLRFLGYFAMLESLLTHPPKPSDPYDSITRQVKKKLTVLDHRLAHPIDYSLFRGASPEFVWSKMYAYRSSLAHGGTSQFDGELKILGNPPAALNLLKGTVKKVMRHALAEPRLIVDLRDC